MSSLNRIYPLLGFVFVIGLWVLLVDVLKVANPLLLPSIKDVLLRLIELIANGTLASDFIATALRWVQGFGLGVILGTISGLLLGVMPRVYRVFEGPIEFLRAMPVTAIFPLFLMVFGIGDESKIAMAFLPTYLLILINASYGVIHASPERRRAIQAFGATQPQIFRHVVCYEALPQIFIGLRLALSLSLVVTVVSEMFIGTDLGLGQRIYDSYLTNSVTTLYAFLIVLGLFGYLLNKISISIEEKVVFWAGRV